jgi:hypothetical protein
MELLGVEEHEVLLASAKMVEAWRKYYKLSLSESLLPKDPRIKL